jgi:uncharacterized protein (DUF1800 family)
MTPTAIAHLFRRAGFGLSPQGWTTWRERSADQAVAALFAQAEDPAPLYYPAPVAQLDRAQRQLLTAAERDARREQSREQRNQIVANWIARMGSDSAPALLERACLFWHGHFACRITDGPQAASYLNALRANALGPFRELALGIAREPAMIFYLNNQQNRKQQPNENFARELMELFTIGRGHYTETDVKEAARAFTGWQARPRQGFFFNVRQHDYGSKTFMGRTGDFNGEQIIDILLEQPATAEFLCRKIYAYFVNPQVDEARVRELAGDYRRDNYHTGRLLYRIFTSEWFYAPAHLGAKIKSPVELVAGLSRQLSLTAEDARSLMILSRSLGQQLLNPPNVAGWPGGRQWVDHTSLMTRLNLPFLLYRKQGLRLRGKAELTAERNPEVPTLQFHPDFQPLLTGQAGLDNAAAQRQLSDYLLAVPISVDVRQIARLAELQRKIDPATFRVLALLSLPEYQFC